MRFEGNKIYCFPRDQSLSDLLTGNFEAGNSLNLAATAVIGQHSRGTLPSDVIDFCKHCRLRDFGGKQFYCKMSRDLKVTNETTRCSEEISSYITRKVIAYTLRAWVLKNPLIGKDHQ